MEPAHCIVLRLRFGREWNFPFELVLSKGGNDGKKSFNPKDA
jgi:hypothetical protein